MLMHPLKTGLILLITACTTVLEGQSSFHLRSHVKSLDRAMGCTEILQLRIHILCVLELTQGNLQLQ